jgi:serine/threonine protein kinase
MSPRDPREVGGYRLLRKIGGGGQGTVYLGTDGSGPVAVKVLDTDFDDTGRLKQALNRELASAQSVAAFVTAQVLAFDLDADPPYIVTEFVDGPTLDDEVRAGRGPLHGSRLADLAIQTALALEAIHAAGVIHCDFKPGNIMLGPGGVKVIDFGIARAWDSVYQAASRVIGSAHFMAPEQVDNRPLGPPVDVFAWGSVMVFAATGRYAFPGANPVAVGLRVVQDEPDLHGMTGPLADLVRACLHKDPKRRPTAAQIRQALMAPAQRTLDMPEETPEPAPIPRRRRGRTGRALVALLLLALVGAGAGWAWRQWDRGGTPSGSPSAPPDPNLVALQQFAAPRSLDGCVPIAPNERQLARRSCSATGAEATYSLYRTAPVDERAEERKRVIRIHNGSPTELRRRIGTSPDGRRGEYIEYVYQAGDDKKWYAAIWWDDGIDNPGGSAVLTMRRPWTDQDDPDPARELRDRWLSWGYRLSG